MPNPFRYGGIVTGEDFADRKQELTSLVGELTSGQNILLYSPRRYGKSSLIMVVLEELEKRGIMTAFIDMYGCVSESDLINKLIEKTVVPAYDKLDNILKFLRSAISGLRPELTVNSDGSVNVSFRKESSPQWEKSLPEILEAPEKLAQAKNKHLVVVFDEFQEIKKLDGDRLEKLMRTSFQHHKLATYVFMGSKRHMIEQMFENLNRPFYKFAKPFPLGKIPIAEFKRFILAKFSKTGISVDPSIVDTVLAFTDGHPYFTQQLCHEIWNVAAEKNFVQKNHVEKAIADILRIHNDLFSKMWDSMTAQQRKLSFALSSEETAVSGIYSVPFIKKYGLISASHVKRAVSKLLGDETIEKTNGGYALADIFFKEWIKDKTKSTKQ
jgi:hypothetical protein